MESTTQPQLQPQSHDVGTHGRDVNLVTVDDWKSLVGTTWIDDKRNERKITAIEGISVHRDGSLLSCTVLWTRSHWGSDRKPYQAWISTFRAWLNKATRVS